MAIKVCFCYARQDELLLNQLKDHMDSLQREGFIEMWYDRNIDAGLEWEKEILKNLNAAQIILLLISPAFMSSNYCFGVEMQRALERHKRNEARVIPVIMRPVVWQHTPLGSLQALPLDAKPVTAWDDRDTALFNIAEGIHKIVKQPHFLRSVGTQPPREKGKRKEDNISASSEDSMRGNRRGPKSIDNFRHLFKQLRVRSGLSQEHLAQKLNIDVGTIKAWEYGKEHPKTIRLLLEIANTLKPTTEERLDLIETGLWTWVQTTEPDIRELHKATSPSALERHFIGRDQDISIFKNWLDDPEAPRILYVHDATEQPQRKGGIGKTWLLRQCVNMIKQEHPDIGVVMIGFFQHRGSR
ncbi:hypothetical protein KSF_066030 [Reticulibacter mediterranei]|uniref:TIR domain-containing protein n=1 Tax=Reticulibacter mediterranei TaxID=2778369 RepID=A0A8J3ITD0_9CHLR|nr:TIR domain-containing protein [Reticulibacter mediterranei]GHO96555.1 hypothetical protein KSF_066030 [Reticulibacter mediterranei]